MSKKRRHEAKIRSRGSAAEQERLNGKNLLKGVQGFQVLALDCPAHSCTLTCEWIIKKMRTCCTLVRFPNPLGSEPVQLGT